MSWIKTYNGKFDFAKMDPADITIKDIAHALANICRFGGHGKEFYSVAQHSVYVSQIVPAVDARAGLMHDATEAYIGDMVRPLKGLIPAFGEFEDRLWRIIAGKYGLPMELPETVHEADDIALAIEARDLMDTDPRTWGLKAPPDGARIFQPWEPEFAEKQFLDRWEYLEHGYETAMMTAFSMGPVS